MKSCPKCDQQNTDEARFCQGCGAAFPSSASQVSADENEFVRTFIGPSKALLFSLQRGWSWDRADNHYIEKFRRFSNGGRPRFALSWHWPAFLVDPFLWFLYRKMYVYAFVYAVSLHTRGDVAGARRALEDLLTLHPGYDPARDLLARIGAS